MRSIVKVIKCLLPIASRVAKEVLSAAATIAALTGTTWVIGAAGKFIGLPASNYYLDTLALGSGILFCVIMIVGTLGVLGILTYRFCKEFKKHWTNL